MLRPLLSFTLLLPQLLFAQGKKASPLANTPLSILSFNTENLFDSEHDPGKEDWTYLPLALKGSPEHRKLCEQSSQGRDRLQDCLQFDWSEKELNEKLRRVAQTILGNKNQCPDLVILVEVENLKILQRLNREFLKSCSYPTAVLKEGDDRRGIDTGLLSRFPLEGEAKLHPISFRSGLREQPKTRGILEVPLLLPGGEKLRAFAIHFPAPYHDFSQRLDAFASLQKLAEAAQPEADIILAAGDFNTPAKEDSRLYRQLASPSWWVSHQVGCSLCLGTHYFKKDDSWSFLDAILLWKTPRRGARTWTFQADSIEIIQNKDFHIDASGMPRRWEHSSKPGLSDHLPIKAWIKPETQP